MGKLKHIILREYSTRIRKKSFIIMTLLGPVLFAALMIIPIWITTLEDQETKKVLVLEYDDYGKQIPGCSKLIKNILTNKRTLEFDYSPKISLGQAKELVKHEAYFGVLVIRHKVLIAGNYVRVEFFANKQPSWGLESHITDRLSEFLYDIKLRKYNVSAETIRKLKTHVELDTQIAQEDGFKASGNINLSRIIGYGAGFLIYMFIFFFGAQVMRGVAEEKTNRIIEVIITSVKPFQLMMGKTIGIGLVGLTQFLSWVILTFFIISGVDAYYIEKQIKEQQIGQAYSKPATNGLFQAPVGGHSYKDPTQKMPELNVESIRKELREIPFKGIILKFIFYFIGGFLLYSAMFAAIGAAVDSETDTQQFMLPVTVPLIISVIVMLNAISNPEGQVAYWFSIIPFTSPVVMMGRVGFDVPLMDFIISGTLLILTYIGMIWLSGKIYRVGILMYGKKVTFREMLRWLRYK